MPIPYDCHTHTVFSDGRNSVEENVRMAEAVGLELVVIADHYWPGDDDLLDRVTRVLEVDAESPVRVVPGVEVMALDTHGTLAIHEREAALAQFVLADLGGHTKGIAIDPPASQDRFIANVFQATMALVQSPLVHAIAHPFNLGRFPATLTPAQLPRNALREVAAALFELDKPFEIMNQMAWWYPDMTERQFTGEYAGLLALMAESNVKFVLGSDAHSCGAVGHLAWCRRVMEEAGIGKSQVVDLPRKFAEKTGRV